MSSLHSADKLTRKVLRSIFDMIERNSPTSTDIINQFDGQIPPNQIKRTIRNMSRRGEIQRTNTDRPAPLSITDKGQQRYEQIHMLAELEEFQQKVVNDNWDGKWRLLIYDILESEHYLRDLIRRLIQELGCQQFQRSVWVTPYDCSRQVGMIQQIYGSKTDIALIEADRFLGDEELLESFNLKTNLID